MGNDYMTSGDNLRMIGHAFAARRAVDQTAANYQAHIDKLQKKLDAMSRELEQTNELFEDVVVQRNAWRETCRHFANGAPREQVLAVYDVKEAEVKSHR